MLENVISKSMRRHIYQKAKRRERERETDDAMQFRSICIGSAIRCEREFVYVCSCGAKSILCRIFFLKKMHVGFRRSCTVVIPLLLPFMRRHTLHMHVEIHEEKNETSMQRRTIHTANIIKWNKCLSSSNCEMNEFLLHTWAKPDPNQMSESAALVGNSSSSRSYYYVAVCRLLLALIFPSFLFIGSSTFPFEMSPFFSPLAFAVAVFVHVFVCSLRLYFLRFVCISCAPLLSPLTLLPLLSILLLMALISFCEHISVAVRLFRQWCSYLPLMYKLFF